MNHKFVKFKLKLIFKFGLKRHNAGYRIDYQYFRL